MPTPEDPQLAHARKLMCSEGGRQWVEDIVPKPFGYRMSQSDERREEAKLPDEEPHYSCTRDHCSEDKPEECWAFMCSRTPEAAEARQATTLEAIRQNVGGCREELGEEANWDKCWKPAEYILWGKLFSMEAFGPRCYDHAAKHVGHHALGDPSWAIVDLGRLARDIDEAHQRNA